LPLLGGMIRVLEPKRGEGRQRSAALPSPNYYNHEDEALKFSGAPDLILLVEGRKLYVHSKKLSTFSLKIQEFLQRPDPMMGKMIQMVGRTVKGVWALLDALYPPQKVPPAETFDEVYLIAKDYKMDMLIEKMKVGIIKNCAIEPLRVAEEKKLDVLPKVVVDAFAEFALTDLRGLEGYHDLLPTTKLEVARRRIEVLETAMMEKRSMDDSLRAHRYLFRTCPDEERAPEGEEDIFGGGSKLNDNGKLMESEPWGDSSGTVSFSGPRGR